MDTYDGLRVFGIRFDIHFQASCLLEPKLTVDRASEVLQVRSN